MQQVDTCLYSRAKVDQLQRSLSCLPQGGLPMQLSELNGFLTGVVLLPDNLPPSRWLPKVWGDRPLEAFSALTEPELAVQLVLEHHNVIVELLNEGAEYEAILQNDTADPRMQVWEAWVDGFVGSQTLVPQPWQGLTHHVDEAASFALEYLDSLAEVAINASLFSEQRLNEIAQAAVALIPRCVLEINRFRKSSTTSDTGGNSGKLTKNCDDNVVWFESRTRMKT